MKRTMLSLLVAGLFAALGSSTMAQNVTADEQPSADAQTNTQPNDAAAGAANEAQPADSQADAASDTQREEDYQAAMKKCEEMSGDEKTTCMDEAKKKSGQM